MKNLIQNTCLILSACLLLVSCGDKDTGQIDASDLDKNTPDGAFLLTMSTLADSDIEAVVKNSLPEDQYNELVTEFETRKQEPMTEQQKAQFNQALVMINQDNAEEQIFSLVAPQLTQIRAYMPMMLMGAKGQISQQLGADETTLAPRCDSTSAVVDGTVTWIMDNDILNEEKVRNGIAALVEMGQDLDISSAEELQNMNFNEALDMAGKVFTGFKKSFMAHGIDINGILRSAEVSNVTVNGDQADMLVSFVVFEKTACTPVSMMKRDGLWVINPEA